MTHTSHQSASNMPETGLEEETRGDHAWDCEFVSLRDLPDVSQNQHYSTIMCLHDHAAPHTTTE
jgi:hypothetical protein